MKCEILRPHELDDQALAVWERYYTSNPSLANPFFSPAFTLIAGKVRPDARVAVYTEGSEIVAFLPFHRAALGRALPIGDYMSDYQGPITAAGRPLDPRSLLTLAGLRSYAFNHVRTDCHPLQPHVYRQHISPQVRTQADGADPIYQELAPDQQRQHAYAKKAQKSLRRMEEAFGPTELVLGSTSEEDFSLLLKWKSDHFIRTHGRVNKMEVGWVRDMLTEWFHTREGSARVMMSVLKTRERTLAISFSLLGNGILHSWFPTYDYDQQIHSPGTVLQHKLIAACPSLGIHTLDLGRGHQEHKRRVMTGYLPLVEGICTSPAFVGHVIGHVRNTREATKARLKALLGRN